MTLSHIFICSSLLVVNTFAGLASPSEGASVKGHHKKGGQGQKQRNVSVAQFSNDVSYAFNYQADEQNFLPGFKEITGQREPHWRVFVNFHGDMELNLSDKFDRKKRTLSWALPYAVAAKRVQTQEGLHHYLALLKSWSGEHFRNYMTFIFVPPNAPFSYKVGWASPQVKEPQSKVVASYQDNPHGRAQAAKARQESKSKRAHKEVRYGTGLQLRLKGIPQGTVAVTMKIDLFGAQGRQGKFGLQTINIHGMFEEALEAFLKAQKITDGGEIDSLRHENMAVLEHDPELDWVD